MRAATIACDVVVFTLASMDPGVYSTDVRAPGSSLQITRRLCMGIPDPTATGIVTLTGMPAAGGLAGTYDFAFDGQGSLQGSFATESCATSE